MNEAIALWIAGILFILAALGIGLLVWMFRDRILPLLPAPRRNWFRFSLRGLLVVVTIFGIGIGWNLHVVRSRREVLLSYVKRGAGFNLDQSHERHIPLIRGLLGDWPAVFDIELPSDIFTPDERERLQSLYPEVRVVVVEGPPMSAPSKEDIEFVETHYPSNRAPLSMYRLGASEVAIILVAVIVAIISYSSVFRPSTR